MNYSAGLASKGALVGLFFGSSLFAQELPRAVPAEVGMSAERLDRLTDVLEEYVDEGRIPGAVTTVLRRGHVVFEDAVGQRDREVADPMSADDIFRIASHTKAVISVGIMILQEEGALLISDPLSRYLPSFERSTVAVPTQDGRYQVVEAEQPITLRHLLTHTAGITYGSGPAADRWAEAGITGWYFAHREEPIRETVDRIATLPFQAHPGETWMYGFSSDILGAVIEVVSGLPLDEFLRTRIFEPLDMRDTRFYLPPEESDRLVTVYGARLGQGLTRAPDGPGMRSQGQYVSGPRTSLSGGAGLLSTARDYSRFLQMLLNGGELNGARILSPTTVRLMTTNHTGGLYEAGDVYWQPGTGFGLGFRIRLDVGASGFPGSEGDYGWLGAYHSYYWVDPVEELVVVHLTQISPAFGLDDEAKLRSLVYAAITESRAR